MAFENVTAAYVNAITSSKFASRTADAASFAALKGIYATYINTQAWPTLKADIGLALLLAHHYALDDTQDPDVGGSDTTVGPVTTEKVGDRTEVRGLQPYIGTVKGEQFYFMQTKWGVQFYNLKKTFKVTPRVT